MASRGGLNSPPARATVTTQSSHISLVPRREETSDFSHSVSVCSTEVEWTPSFLRLRSFISPHYPRTSPLKNTTTAIVKDYYNVSQRRVNIENEFTEGVVDWSGLYMSISPEANILTMWTLWLWKLWWCFYIVDYRILQTEKEMKGVTTDNVFLMAVQWYRYIIFFFISMVLMYGLCVETLPLTMIVSLKEALLQHIAS